MALIDDNNYYDYNKNETNKNEYFQLNNNNFELQRLNEVQSAEYISLYGVDIQYIKLDETDMTINQIIGEIENKTYRDVINLRMLMSSNSGFDGGGDIFNKIGFSVPDEMTFIIDMKTIERFIGRTPMLSDLILHLPSNKMFKITWVDDEVVGTSSFYSGGTNYLYKMVAKQYKLAKDGDVFETNNDDIDVLNEIQNITTIDLEQEMNETEPSDIGIYDDEDNNFN